MILTTALLLAAQSPSACSGLTPRLTPALRRTEAARVASVSRLPVRPTDVSHVIGDGNWRLVFATPRNSERGVFVIRRVSRDYRLVDTWGGVMALSDRGQAAKWARSLPGGGVPAALANCMERAIIAGR
jgi:hypothetical protein